ncbi:MAG: hypothetical protein ACI4XF_09725 [Oscillospiraceae bacterium]
MYKSDSDDTDYVRPTVVQHGDMSSLSYVMESGYLGSAFLLWMFVLLVISGIVYSSVDKEDDAQSSESAKKSGKKKKKKKKK